MIESCCTICLHVVMLCICASLCKSGGLDCRRGPNGDACAPPLHVPPFSAASNLLEPDFFDEDRLRRPLPAASCFAMDSSRLVACLDATINPDPNVRLASELELRKVRSAGGAEGEHEQERLG